MTATVELTGVGVADGAPADEVELDVTEKIEKAVQGLGPLKRVASYSERGMSKVKVVIKLSVMPKNPSIAL